MEVKDWNPTDDSNLSLGAIDLSEGVTTINQGNDIPRALMGAIARQLGDVGFKGANIISAATTNLANATGWYCDVSGNTTITSFGTVAAGQLYILRFTGSPRLTHNATSLIIPGATDIVMAPGDVAFMMSLGSGNWRCVHFQRFASAPETGTSVSDSPPVDPLPGQLWFESDSGRTYIWYVDVDSAQWVEIGGTGGSASSSDVITPQMFGAKADGVTDDTAAVQAAIDTLVSRGGGRLLFAEAGDYLISSINMASDIEVNVTAGATLVHKAGSTAAMFKAIGAKSGTSLALTGTVNAGATSLSLTDASSISIGDWIILRDTTAYNSADATYKSGESLIVKDKTGNTLYFDRLISGSFQDDRAYTLARGASVVKVNAPLSNISFSGEGRIYGNQVSPENLIEFAYVDGARVTGLSLEHWSNVAIKFTTCRNCEARPRYLADGKNDAATGHFGYGVCAAEACDGVMVADIFATRNRHTFTTVGGADGAPSRVTVTNTMTVASDFTALDTHDGVHDILFSNNTVYGGNASTPAGPAGGINTRAPTTRMIGNVLIGVPGKGLRADAESMRYLYMANNYIQDCGDIGISIASGVLDSCEIVNNTLIRTGQDAISLGAGTFDTEVSRWSVKGNTVRHWGIAGAGRAGIKLSTTTASEAWIEGNTVQAIGGAEAYGIYISGASVVGRVFRNMVIGSYVNAAYLVPTLLRGPANYDAARPVNVQIAIADDGVYDLPVDSGALQLMYSLTTGSVAANRINGIILARTDAIAPGCSAVSTMGANVTLTTAISTSAAAIDGNFTVSAVAGHLYFINRSGGSLTITIQRLTDIIVT